MRCYDSTVSKVLTLYTSTQIPHIVRTALAEALDWDETKLRVIAPDVGGGFGMKAYLYPEELIAAYLARELDAPIKWIGDRREDLLSSLQGRGYRFDVALAFTAEGDLIGARADILCDIGAYPGYPFGASTGASGAAIYLPGPYRMPHYAYETRAIATHTCPAGVYRGVAAPSAFFATEALMDRAAQTLGLDPAEIRRRNVLIDADLPYTTPAVNIPYTSGTFQKCLHPSARGKRTTKAFPQQTAGRPDDRRQAARHWHWLHRRAHRTGSFALPHQRHSQHSRIR